MSLILDEPINAVMPALSQDIALIVLWVLYAVYVGIGVRMLQTKKDDTFLILALSALFASPAEPFTCFMVKCCYPPVGNYALYKYLWKSVPWFMPPCYSIYISIWAFFVIRSMKKNPSHALFWKFTACLWVFAWLFEMVTVQSGLWFYFGNQPLVLLGFPMYESFVNANLVMGFAAAALCCFELFSGYRRYLLLFFGCMSVYATYASTTWPIAAMLHWGYPTNITIFGALGTIMLSLLECYFFAHMMMFVITSSKKIQKQTEQVFDTIRSDVKETPGVIS